MNPFKHDDLENHPNSNQLPLFENQIPFNTSYIEKTDEVLQTETRGVDFKGQVRYFCPRCNVRYIGEFIHIHSDNCIIKLINFPRIQVFKNAHEGMWKCL